MTRGADQRPRLAIVGSKQQAGEEMLSVGAEYSEMMAPHIVDSCVRLGMAVELAPIFKNHLSDLHVAIRDDPKGHECEDPAIAVKKIKLPGIKKPTWKRLFIVGRHQIEDRQEELAEVITARGIEELDDAKVHTAAFDWLFYEFAALSALGNSCYMRRNIPKGYMEDFNGQSPYYRTEHILSSDYLLQTGTQGVRVEDDYKALRQGFGLRMLHEGLLLKGVVERAKLADWIIEELRQRTPDAYRGDLIAEHLKLLRPDRYSQGDLGKLTLYLARLERDES